MLIWLIVVGLFVGLLAVNVTFLMTVRAIRRDTTRFDELQRRLESRANSIVDHIFNANRIEP